MIMTIILLVVGFIMLVGMSQSSHGYSHLRSVSLTNQKELLCSLCMRLMEDGLEKLATTVMVVGFVNSGIMTLKQAVGVIMGANIGCTVLLYPFANQVVSLAEKTIRDDCRSPANLQAGMKV